MPTYKLTKPFQGIPAGTILTNPNGAIYNYEVDGVKRTTLFNHDVIEIGLLGGVFEEMKEEKPSNKCNCHEHIHNELPDLLYLKRGGPFRDNLTDFINMMAHEINEMRHNKRK